MEDLKFSRPAAVAALLGDDGQRFMDKRVLLCGEASVLNTPSGHEAFRASFLLLIRICQHVAIALPEACDVLRADIAALAQRMVPERPWEILDPDRGALQDFDAILSIGTHAHADLPWTVINADGWIARVSSRGADLPTPTDSDNAIAAIGAACLGVSEVFKRLIRLKPNRGELLDSTNFSLWSYSLSDDPGPPLYAFAINVLIIGCGAIGSGVGYTLSRCPVSGRAFTLDPQEFARENFGTSIAIGPADYHSKAEVIAELLKPKLTAKGFVTDIAGFSKQYDGTFPDVILTGLDEVDPRHQAQGLWPGLIIDGAVGGELSCQVSCHPWDSDIACLICLFQRPPSKNLAELNARATGLPSEIANDPNAVVTDDLIAKAETDRRPWLRKHLGKRICSITSEAVVTFLSAEAHREGFAPAVPFVSCFSACMMVTELVRFVSTGKTLPEPRYQLNLLWGPRRGLSYDEGRRADCICVERRENISRWRTKTQQGMISASADSVLARIPFRCLRHFGDRLNSIRYSVQVRFGMLFGQESACGECLLLTRSCHADGSWIYASPSRCFGEKSECGIPGGICRLRSPRTLLITGVKEQSGQTLRVHLREVLLRRHHKSQPRHY